MAEQAAVKDEPQVMYVEHMPISTQALLAKAELDQQISTAKAFPRSVTRFLNELTTLATKREDVAEACIFALPRAGKTIEGASIRFAELVNSTWGNSRAITRIVHEEAETVTAQGVFHDLEHNAAVSVEVKRRITDKHGKRFSPDMIVVTSNAACSIALRNAILRGVPKALWEPVYQDCRRVVAGDAKTIANRRADALAYLQKLGVTVDMVLATLEIAGVEDIGQEELVTLKATARQIRDGEVTVEEAFIDPAKRKAEPVPGANAPGMAGLKAAVGAEQPAAGGPGQNETAPEASAPPPAETPAAEPTPAADRVDPHPILTKLKLDPNQTDKAFQAAATKAAIALVTAEGVDGEDFNKHQEKVQKLIRDATAERNALRGAAK